MLLYLPALTAGLLHNHSPTPTPLPQRKVGQRKGLARVLLKSEQLTQVNKYAGTIENRSSKLSRWGPQCVNFARKRMSLSLEGGRSAFFPFSNKASILRAPPGLCHQLRAAITCQRLFSPEPDALSEPCRNLFLLIKTSQLLSKPYVSGAILWLGTQSPRRLSRCPGTQMHINNYTSCNSFPLSSSVLLTWPS